MIQYVKEEIRSFSGWEFFYAMSAVLVNYLLLSSACDERIQNGR